MASGNTLQVEVVTAESSLYSGLADQVVAPGADGQMGILPKHAPLLSVLAPGLLRITLGNAEEAIFVSGGFLEVKDNKVVVLADAAEHAEEIDASRAAAAREQARERLAEAKTQGERREIQSSLEQAVVRLRVSEFARRSTRRRINLPSSED
jgi:F-type H+-transporting ATPase subunit epsilon